MCQIENNNYSCSFIAGLIIGTITAGVIIGVLVMIVVALVFAVWKHTTRGMCIHYCMYEMLSLYC